MLKPPEPLCMGKKCCYLLSLSISIKRKMILFWICRKWAKTESSLVTMLWLNFQLEQNSNSEQEQGNQCVLTVLTEGPRAYNRTISVLFAQYTASCCNIAILLSPPQTAVQTWSTGLHLHHSGGSNLVYNTASKSLSLCNCLALQCKCFIILIKGISYINLTKTWEYTV